MANVLAANELRKGIVFQDEGDTLRVLDYQHKKYGRGQATVRVKVKNISSGAISEKTYDSGAKLVEADTNKRSAQFLYTDDKNAFFMDMEDYNQFSLEINDIAMEVGFLKEGEKVITMYLDGAPVSIDLPKTVELEVVESSPAVAGDTVNNASKRVKLETGLEINVPMFIKQGDKLKVNTDSGEYISRI